MQGKASERANSSSMRVKDGLGGCKTPYWFCHCERDLKIANIKVATTILAMTIAQTFATFDANVLS